MILLSWIVVGIFMGPVVYFYVPVTLVVLGIRKQYFEMLLGFFLMLTLSDSREGYLFFASTVKEIYIIILALFMLLDSKSFRPFNGITLWFIPFLVIAYVCMFNGPQDYMFNAFQKTTSYMLLLIVVPNYVQRAHLDRGKDFYKGVIFLTSAILIAGFIFRFLKPEMVYREGRYQGILGNPNGLGIFSLLSFLFLQAGLVVYPDLLNRRNKIIVYTIILLSIILSGSRGSLFGFLIFFGFSYFYRISPFIGTAAAIILSASFGYISANIVSIIQGLGLESYLRTETLAEGSGRFVAWQFSWQHIQESYWLGRGFEYTEHLFNIPEYVVYLQALGHQGNAHNSYITLWLDTGLIGLIAYLMAFFSRFFKAVRKTRIALPILFAAIFSSFFESWLTASLNPFTIQLFMILSIISSDVILTSKATVAVPVQ